jgi:hypothetical protein
VVSGPADLVRVMRALFDGQLLSATSLQRMLSQRDGFGLGITTWPTPAGLAYGHEGVIDGFAAMLAHVPSAQITLAFTGNAYQLPRDTAYVAFTQAAMQPAAHIPTYTVRTQTVRFELEMPPRAPSPANSASSALSKAPSMHLRGNAPPLSWETHTPMRWDSASGIWVADVPLQLRDGVPLQYKYLAGDNWERTDNRHLQLAASSSSSLHTQRDNWEHDAARTALKAQVLKADAALFDGLNLRKPQALRDGFGQQLEFFHDKTGLTDYAHNVGVFERAIASGRNPTRELLPGSEVFPLADFGALHQGWHAFCEPARPAAGASQPSSHNCNAVRFMHLWQRQADGGYKLHRVISYDH